MSRQGVAVAQPVQVAVEVLMAVQDRAGCRGGTTGLGASSATRRSPAKRALCKPGSRLMAR